MITFIVLSLLFFFAGKKSLFEKEMKSLSLDNYSGKNIQIAVIDSGTDENFNNHLEEIDFTGEGTTDYLGHGSKVVEIIIGSEKIEGLSPSAVIHSLKILTKNGRGKTSTMIEAIEWCIENNINIINLSVATNNNSTELHNVIKKATEKNIIIISSYANNQSAGTNSYPAAYEETIGVRATDDKKTSYIDKCIYIPKLFIRKDIGTENSYATAVCTAIFARILEKKGNDININLLFNGG